MADAVFTSSIQQYQPLERLLRERSRTAIENVGNVNNRQFEVLSDQALLERLTADWLVFAKPLRRTGPPTISPEPRSVFRRNDTHVAPMYWRWWAQYPLEGNLEFLRHWPSDFGEEPCSSDLEHEPAPPSVWQASEIGALAFFDAPYSDDSDGTSVPEQRIVQATAFLDRFVGASNRQLETYQQSLFTRLADDLRDRRARLGRIADRVVKTIELVRVEHPVLEVDPVDTHAAQEGENSARSGALENSVDLEYRLSTKSFSDLVEATQQWGRGAERYPDALRALREDGITDLLVATLNVVFDSAHREVFSYGGKTDVYVEAERGSKSRAAYIGEAKIWNGEKKARAALPQLLGNATSGTRELLLLFYIRIRSIDEARAGIRRAIESAPGFRTWAKEEEQALIHHPEFGHDVEVAIVTIHLPKRRRRVGD